MSPARARRSLPSWAAALAFAHAALPGCNDPKDACLVYSDDRYSKYISCSTPTPTDWDDTAPCTDARIALASCLDACLSRLDCDCVHDPTMPGCTEKLQPYHDCVSVCTTPR